VSRPPAGPGAPLRLGIDVGGTFTDFVRWDGSAMATLKLPSTPDDPGRAILEGVGRLMPAGASAVIVHGSTIATNALIERRGARVALVTNAGFEDLLEIGRQERPELYALAVRRPAPLVARGHCFGVAGRIGPGGHQLEALDTAAAERLAGELRAQAIESVAVCLLHSYANPEHELRLGAILAQAGLAVTLSHQTLKQIGEVERASTTVANAYLSPLVSEYLRRLSDALPRHRLHVLCSDGGRVPMTTAATQPARLALSGPAGGAVGTAALLRRLGLPRALALDMGGTSTDVSLIESEPPIASERRVAGVSIHLPAVDIHTIGAGGGSIAWVDPGGALKVGPQSAGAEPGPACYGRGDHFTVTDAQLVLGRLQPDVFLGGAMPLRLDRALAAGRPLAQGLGYDSDRLAEGVVQVVIANMARALRSMSVARGHDPRTLPLVAFGGAAGLHAAGLIDELGLPGVILPELGSLLSAFGMLAAAPAAECSETVLLALASPELDRRRDRLAAAARAAAHDQGLEIVELRSWAELRYRGQGSALRVEDSRDPTELRGRFESAHRRLFGYVHAGRDLEVHNLGVRATGRPELDPTIAASPTSGDRLPRSWPPRAVVVGGRKLEVPIWSRAALPDRLVGPVVVVESMSTIWVPPEFTLRAGPAGSLILERAS
jgi:N-methylhydantoinase A/oxoprolinase/acetone carboxylase beta subunit